MSTPHVFEENYQSDEFKASNFVTFQLRDQVFKVERRTMAQLQAEADEARENPKRITTYHSWFENNLNAADFDRFWQLVNTEGNPVKSQTLLDIIAYVQGKLNGIDDTEAADTPKD